MNLDSNEENLGESSRNTNVNNECDKTDKTEKGKAPINPKNKQRVKKTSKNKTDQSIDKRPSEINTREDVQKDDDTGIKDILRKMSDDMHSMQELLNR